MVPNDDSSEIGFTSPTELARIGHGLGILSSQAVSSIEGLSTLRNLAATSPGPVSVEQAKEFLALADAVIYALRSVKGLLP